MKEGHFLGPVRLPSEPHVSLSSSLIPNVCASLFLLGHRAISTGIHTTQYQELTGNMLCKGVFKINVPSICGITPSGSQLFPIHALRSTAHSKETCRSLGELTGQTKNFKHFKVVFLKIRKQFTWPSLHYSVLRQPDVTNVPPCC